MMNPFEFLTPFVLIGLYIWLHYQNYLILKETDKGHVSYAIIQLLVLAFAGFVFYLGTFEKGFMAGFGHALFAMGVLGVNLIITFLVYLKLKAQR